MRLQQPKTYDDLLTVLRKVASLILLFMFPVHRSYTAKKRVGQFIHGSRILVDIGFSFPTRLFGYAFSCLALVAF